MIEAIASSKEELKRADHLIYVSLKYTRTVDVIKSIIDRLLNAHAFMVDASIQWAQREKIIAEDAEVPKSPVMKAERLGELFKDNETIVNFLDFYLFLRKVARAGYTAHREYRRHVTMSAMVDGKQIDITIDVIHGYYERSKEFQVFLEEKLSDEEKAQAHEWYVR
ncbi:hypothetical protein COY28_01480 [Candidatus Woesearchaeota archaeon CG_4_10_14_0_2_um_filter_57_5]|nr:MAG: hypothetical protein AUJ68_00505 [Candidatus Woesearchaeota archaeon CG1_02_57_44]PIN68322.1 MAG: hypothetical protein COV94_05290 [Candidatus Woesearchaeota archaeon CG11_big_fil_rev_8_21_14_0_20_57_5]PIZ55816.1 MAG: hypothetical protein COY28_01480 [Candidatus Woesearchaeota archaeon CG_4_10_14_0_2_um_filter_57_5]